MHGCWRTKNFQKFHACPFKYKFYISKFVCFFQFGLIFNNASVYHLFKITAQFLCLFVFYLINHFLSYLLILIQTKQNSYYALSKINVYISDKTVLLVHIKICTVFQRTVSAETILFWKWKMWKFSYSFRIMSRKEIIRGNSVYDLLVKNRIWTE